MGFILGIIVSCHADHKASLRRWRGNALLQQLIGIVIAYSKDVGSFMYFE